MSRVCVPIDPEDPITDTDVTITRQPNFRQGPPGSDPTRPNSDFLEAAEVARSCEAGAGG